MYEPVIYRGYRLLFLLDPVTNMYSVSWMGPDKEVHLARYFLTPYAANAHARRQIDQALGEPESEIVK